MPTINTLIFDFGDVFINLDKKGAVSNALTLFKIEDFTEDMLEANEKLELGKISDSDFFEFYTKKFPDLSKEHILMAWNFILRDFPFHRLKFIKRLKFKGDYQLLLLSNTSKPHIDYIKKNVPFYEEFKACFDKFYLSHEIGYRKPNKDIFEFMIRDNNLNPNQCLFIDDTIENTNTANSMGFHIWNIDQTREDVVDLFNAKKDLF